MSVIYATTVKTPRMTATRDEVGGGTLVLMSATDAVLASFTLSAAGGTVAGAVWTLGFASTSTTGTAAAGTGTDATKAEVRDSVSGARITGLTVGLSGTDIIIDNVNIAEAQNVSLNGAQTITHA